MPRWPLAGGRAQRWLDDLLACFRERGLLPARGKPRSASTPTQAAARTLNCLECVGATLR